MSQATMVAKVHPISSARLIAACTIGNGLEFYDFIVFSYFATVIGKEFFPTHTPATQLLLALALYGTGFFMRPIGGIVLGGFADARGRKKATILTLMMMAAGTFIVGIAPNYATAGTLGSLVLVFGRLLQGFSAGGEVGASTTLLSEAATPANRGFFGSWQLASQGLAGLVVAMAAIIVNKSMSPEAVQSWGWRIPFILGVLIVPIGLWLRSALEETHANIDDPRARNIIVWREVFRAHWRQLIKGVCLVIGGTAATNVILLYMPTYAVTTLHISSQGGLMAGLAAGLATLVASPIGGYLSDRFGRKTIIVSVAIIMLALLYPSFAYLNAHPSIANLVMIVGGLAIFNAFAGAAGIVMLTELFPSTVRATGMALVYALGVTVFGGFGPFIVAWLIHATGSPIAPAYYVMACMVVTMIALYFVPETKGTILS
ncbi:MAG: MFS transporter [Hyphomicrobiales bacterium]|nr:MFS transporter [Hyphomicrobiales bacterium]MDE2113313.1 MFS transporter [Hyphomicrobiales bacterium]